MGSSLLDLVEVATDAVQRCSEDGDVELRFSGATRAGGSSSAVDPRNGERGAPVAVAGLCQAVLERGPAVDSARAAAAGAALAGALHDSQRANAHGAARVQHALSMVRRLEHG